MAESSGLPLPRLASATARILRRRHNLHVRRVLAKPITAKVIDAKPGRNDTVGEFPSESMRVYRPAILSESPVTVRDGSLGPGPTTFIVRLVNKRPEMFRRSDEYRVFRRNAKFIAADSGYSFVLVERATKAGFESKTPRVAIPANVIPSEDNGVAVVIHGPGPNAAFHNAKSNRLWEAAYAFACR